MSTNRVVVAGYRDADRDGDPVVPRRPRIREHRRACLTYVVLIAIAQIGWIAALVLHTSVATPGPLLPCLCFEMSVPYVAERRRGGTPWHAHHIAERYSLFAIIALGEGVVGTVATLSAIVGEQG